MEKFELEELELRNLSSKRLSNRIIPPSQWCASHGMTEWMVWPRATRWLVLGYHFGGSQPPWSCHTSCHTLAPCGGYDNSMAGGRLVCIRYYLAHGYMASHQTGYCDFEFAITCPMRRTVLHCVCRAMLWPISELRFWISEGLTQAEPWSEGVEFPGL